MKFLCGELNSQEVCLVVFINPLFHIKIARGHVFVATGNSQPPALMTALYEHKYTVYEHKYTVILLNP